jgi:chromosome partitioning protein
MLAYTTYSESGGVGKTTLTANLAYVHGQHGRDVLTIDLDPQQGSLTHLLDVDTPRDHAEMDNLTRHLIDRPKGPFEDLIHQTTHGFDLLPAHNMLENLSDLLNQAEELAADLGDEFTPYDRLRQVLADANIHETYDTIIVDPPATAGPQLYNAISATRSLVLPVEPTGKGVQAVDGLKGMVQSIEATFGFDIGVLAIVPNQVGHTTDQQQYVDQFRELGHNIPVIIRDRASLFEGCWDERCTAFEYVDIHRSQRREYELETLEKLRTLGGYLEECET